MPTVGGKAADLKPQLLKILERMGLELKNAWATSDAGQPMPKIFEDGVKAWFRCLSHMSQNAVKAAAESITLFVDLMKIVDTITLQLTVSTKRSNIYTAACAQFAITANVTQPPALGSSSVVRWDSWSSKLERLVSNLPVIMKIKPADYPFRDGEKKTAFAAAVKTVSGSSPQAALVRLQLTELSALLKSVRIFNKETQGQGVSIHKFSGIGDRLVSYLDDFDGDPGVKDIAAKIKEEFLGRYSGK